MMQQEVAVNNVGNIKQPNQPMYKRFSVLVIQAEKRSHTETLSRLSKVAVIKNFIYYKSSHSSYFWASAAWLDAVNISFMAHVETPISKDDTHNKIP
jgi:hypothetical protein